MEPSWYAIASEVAFGDEFQDVMRAAERLAAQIVDIEQSIQQRLVQLRTRNLNPGDRRRFQKELTNFVAPYLDTEDVGTTGFRELIPAVPDAHSLLELLSSAEQEQLKEEKRRLSSLPVEVKSSVAEVIALRERLIELLRS